MAAAPPRTTAATRLLCLLGHPVSHSLSPLLHSAAIAEAGIDAVYLAFDVEPPAFETTVAGLLGAGLLGANATIPHKHAALAFADRATDEASFIGAANTLYRAPDGAIVADNTDAAGLRDVLVDDCRVAAADEVLIYGAGGAARAAAVALGRIGAAVTVRARRSDAAAAVQALARQAGGAAPRGDQARVVVNATPLGRHGERLPAEVMVDRPDAVALDLNYGPASPFLLQARRAGAVAVDGLGMLVGQARAAFERWTGLTPSAEVMAEALLDAASR